MPSDIVAVREHRSRLGLDDSLLGVGAGEPPDRVDRVPERDGQELGAPSHRSSEQTGAAMARNATQTGKYGGRGVSLIGIGIPSFRHAAP